ncbi:hypothetical protein C1645_837226 [Glomus cerebriforme]|uniref:Uncharacterized protein n=1 Tax=Glomus cerebriforme TaxID=658196 RepID=A0A397SBB8_9GLOM|nr:hypothetical protein C1645_837226 [Glomus cerebriforme]
MQAESFKNNFNFPDLEFFLPDDEYDSDESFNFLEYDFVEKLNEIDMEQYDEITDNEEMEKIDDCIVEDSDVVFKDKEDDFIVKNKEDDVMVENEEKNNNLQKRKRKRSKKILLQTDIDKLQNKLHANKYFMKEITPELVHCKCGKEIHLDQKFRNKNLTMHGELNNYNYSREGQQTEFGGSIRPNIAARELFSEIVKTKLKLKNLGESGICDECDKLKKNNRLNQATKKQQASGKNIHFIPKYYLKHPLNKLLMNTNLKSLWVSADDNNHDAEIWIKLVQFEKDGIFKEEKTS